MTTSDKPMIMLEPISADILFFLWNECQSIGSTAEFERLIRTQVRAIIPHEKAFCGLCDLKNKHLLSMISIDVPEIPLQRIRHHDGSLNQGPLLEWASSLAMSDTAFQSISTCNRADFSYGMTNFTCQGVRIQFSSLATFFAFGSDCEGSICNQAATRLVVLQLHEAMLRLLNASHVQPRDRMLDGQWSSLEITRQRRLVNSTLTNRETEVLAWIARGKTNWEIGRVLQISEFTVKNHIQSIMRKLEVTTRTQAVASAISAGILKQEQERIERERKLHDTFIENFLA